MEKAWMGWGVSRIDLSLQKDSPARVDRRHVYFIIAWYTNGPGWCWLTGGGCGKGGPASKPSKPKQGVPGVYCLGEGIFQLAILQMSINLTRLRNKMNMWSVYG